MRDNRSAVAGNDGARQTMQTEFHPQCTPHEADPSTLPTSWDTGTPRGLKPARLDRTIFETSRLLEYFTDRELRYQTGKPPSEWPQVVVKELVDNALDACEDAGTPPEIDVTVETGDTMMTIAVSDNGPGLAPETVAKILDFSVRVSDKEAYVSPSRGAQGNALKTIIAIPFVSSTAEPKEGHVTIESRGIRHDLTVRTDLVKQAPDILHEQTAVPIGKNRVAVTLEQKLDFTSTFPPFKQLSFYETLLRWLRSYALFNPHAAFRLETPKGNELWPARDPAWTKWTPSDPTSGHWYMPDDLGRLMGAHIARSEATGERDLTIREFVGQFRGLTSTIKQKRVAQRVPQNRLSEFISNGNGHRELNDPAVAGLLAAMKAESQPVKPAHLGVLGKDRIFNCLRLWHDLEEEPFEYTAFKGFEQHLPYTLEIALAQKKDDGLLERYLGLNFAPSHGDPFADWKLAYDCDRKYFASVGLTGILGQFKVELKHPLVFVLHLTLPGARFGSRAKDRLQ